MEGLKKAKENLSPEATDVLCCFALSASIHSDKVIQWDSVGYVYRIVKPQQNMRVPFTRLMSQSYSRYFPRNVFPQSFTKKYKV